MSLGHRSNEYWRFNGKVFAGIDLWDGLKFQTSFAYAFDLNATKSYSPKSPARYDAEGILEKRQGKRIRRRIIGIAMQHGRVRTC